MERDGTTLLKNCQCELGVTEFGNVNYDSRPPAPQYSTLRQETNARIEGKRAATGLILARYQVIR
jgi:hypothetical protein